ncbi:benzoate 4-monooxygenase cytochrome P450 [Xylaria scruposa]|nr:benzoate 4-monooxygenase cytochrome P450 [Xylaria scruposa]
MPTLPLSEMSLAGWLLIATLLCALMFSANVVYNLYLHPLAHIPGPLLGRASSIPSWYYAYRGTRHIWLWQQFQIYGNKIRPEPNTVLFCDPEAYVDIYGMKSNVRRSKFYTAWQRNDQDQTTLNTVDVAAHARKRKLLNLAFTESSVRAASSFIIKHVDRWHQILVEDAGASWSAAVDFSDKVDSLTFDIMGDLCFGASFDIKEPRENPLKSIPHYITNYMQFYYPICRSPFLNLVVWLKPRGLNKLFELLTPPPVQQYYKFVHNSVTKRIALQQEQAKWSEAQRRQDIFYFLCEARNPDTGFPAYNEADLRAEANLLIIAGSDTTAISLSGIFFYLTGDSRRCNKLIQEVRTTFKDADDIVYGPKLLACVYLKACIDEGMRLTPSGPSELSREVLPGGLNVQGEYLPAGTIVGTVPWVNSRNQEVYGDPDVFRPERWIVDETVTTDDVARLKSNFHPFSAGPGNCIGKNIAMVELMIVVARTLHRLDVRREPGSTIGGGAPGYGWGATDRKQFHLIDAYISLRHGPMVQFRKRQSVAE